MLWLMFILQMIMATACYDSIIYCNGRCDETHVRSSSSDAISDICSVTENAEMPGIFDKPQQKPIHVNASWYLYETDDGDAIAINVTWIDRSFTALSEKSSGYMMEIVPSSTSVTDRILFQIWKVFIGKHDPRLASNTKVFFNYKCYGLYEQTSLIPGDTLYITVSSLPLPKQQELTVEFRSTSIVIPECTKSEVSHTINCISNSVTEPFLPTSDNSDGSIVPGGRKPSKPAISEKTAPAITIIPCLTALSIVLILLCILTKVCNREDLTAQQKTLFIVISEQEVKAESNYAKAGDELAQYFSKLGMKVVYSLWKTTEINSSNPIAWVEKRVTEAQHVIVICTPAMFINLFEDKGMYRYSQEEPLMNLDMDPSRIVINIIKRDYNKTEKYCFVHFNKMNSKKIPKLQVHQLPDNVKHFCCKITGTKRPKGIGNLKENLIALTKEMKGTA